LEVHEAIQTLQGGGPEDFREHCLVAASHMLVLGGVAADEIQGRQMAQNVIENRKAWERFSDLVRVQGGDVSYVESPERLPKAPIIEAIRSPRSGYLRQIHARIVGETAVLLGAGRAKKGDPVDHAVGIEILHKIGDEIAEGEALFVVHAHDTDSLHEASQHLLEAHAWSNDPVDPLPLFYGVVKSEEIEE
jgi:pyrimidine-nucleoside phosphorylase